MRTAPFNINTPAPFSVAQLADRWGCSTGLVRKLIDSGALQCFRLGALIRISVAEVEKYECETTNPHTPSSASEEASPSSNGALRTESASASAPNSFRKIAKAPRRKRDKSGKLATIHRGPWKGS